jgi:hypothetical protein
MPAKKTTKHKNLQDRNGRYWARLSVPKALRPVVQQSELWEALGPDLTVAKRKLPGVIGRMQDQLNDAREQLRAEQPRIAPQPRAGRILSLGNLAKAHFDSELEKHHSARRADLSAMASVINYQTETVQPFYAEKLRKVVQGLASNEEADALIGWAIDSFRENGNTKVQFGTPEWRELAQALAAVHLETMKLKSANDAGDFSVQPQHPLLVKKPPSPDDPLKIRIIGPA